MTYAELKSLREVSLVVFPSVYMDLDKTVTVKLQLMSVEMIGNELTLKMQLGMTVFHVSLLCLISVISILNVVFYSYIARI